MSYYFLFVMLFMAVAFGVDAWQKKEMPQFLKATGVLLMDGIREPAKVEKELWKIIPPEEGSDFCHRLVYHGREVCTARTHPYCEKCCISDICKKVGI